MRMSGLPGEILEACEWKARKELGKKASRLDVATYVKRMTKADARAARHEHALHAAINRP